MESLKNPYDCDGSQGTLYLQLEFIKISKYFIFFLRKRV